MFLHYLISMACISLQHTTDSMQSVNKVNEPAMQLITQQVLQSLTCNTDHCVGQCKLKKFNMKNPIHSLGSRHVSRIMTVRGP